jgi:SAM-dependent methyltransferase
VRLNLGSGGVPQYGYINIDSRRLPGVDIVRDVLRGLPFADVTVEEVYSENFLEHIPQTEVIWLMNEIHRVLIPRGRAIHLVPRAGTTNFWQDPTHLSHWIPDTLTYFQENNPRNLYYGGMIIPWKDTRWEDVGPNGVMLMELTK